ncbi:VWA domain-containing protein [Candidatus Haliotispira prima]|uniref:VWA domain-containing protein n=1 Tax=Candidatus Haliotispira prima TaxID=3034016 RepID=A0ABY8MIT3_9SPIO|nr:VWA domain-containing protein [Candidatus Haliotispira prima]
MKQRNRPVGGRPNYWKATTVCPVLGARWSLCQGQAASQRLCRFGAGSGTVRRKAVISSLLSGLSLLLLSGFLLNFLFGFSLGFSGTVLVVPTLSAQDNIRLRPGELYIEYKPGEDGFHLWVENKREIGSILITDHTDDPAKKQHVYALRAPSYNIYNGDEKRMLNGKFLPNSLHSLIDSTPESNPYFPRGAFHTFIPFTVDYGYPWSRNGSKTVGKGSWLNIRTFSKAYADYSGAFQDNPFVLSMPGIPEKEDTEPVAVQPSVAKEDIISEPVLTKKRNPPSTPAITSVLNNIDRKIDDLSLNTIDIALVLDTTISMRDNVKFLRTELIPLVEEKIAKFDSFRIGIVLYRDYGEEYLVKPFDFNDDLKRVQEVLDGITVHGGGDKPEAVYEGIYAALTDLKWHSTKRLVIQVGDAPPHPRPKGKVTETMILTKSREMLVQLQQINLNDVESQHDDKSLAQDRTKLAVNSSVTVPERDEFQPF